MLVSTADNGDCPVPASDTDRAASEPEIAVSDPDVIIAAAAAIGDAVGLDEDDPDRLIDRGRLGYEAADDVSRYCEVETKRHKVNLHCCLLGQT